MVVSRGSGKGRRSLAAKLRAAGLPRMPIAESAPRTSQRRFVENPPGTHRGGSSKAAARAPATLTIGLPATSADGAHRRLLHGFSTTLTMRLSVTSADRLIE